LLRHYTLSQGELHDPSKIFEIELTDDGMEGDSVAEDDIFSKKMHDQKFGFRVIPEATDSFVNKRVQEVPDTFMLH
jgi:hypothetical protein